MFLKKEGDKFQARDPYIVVSITGHLASVQKITRGKFMSRTYEVPLKELFPAVKHQVGIRERLRSPSSSEDEELDLSTPETIPNGDSSSGAPGDDATIGTDAVPLRTSTRQRREPGWLRKDILGRE